MKKIKYFILNNKAIILVSLGLAISIGISGYTIFRKIALEKQVEQLIFDAKAADGKISLLTNKSKDFENQTKERTKEISDLKSTLKDSDSKVEAFAKQAASCEKIKRRLHIKE